MHLPQHEEKFSTIGGKPCGKGVENLWITCGKVVSFPQLSTGEWNLEKGVVENYGSYPHLFHIFFHRVSPFSARI